MGNQERRRGKRMQNRVDAQVIEAKRQALIAVYRLDGTAMTYAEIVAAKNAGEI